MKCIMINENKTLKLQNVLSYRLDVTSEDQGLFKQEVNKMNIFIHTHGAKQVGPLIQYSNVVVNEEDQTNVEVKFMLQSDNFIHNVEPPYYMDSVIRIKNCIYARYTGPEDKLRFAYDKLGVYAFENDIELEGCNYTIYVGRNKEEETMIVDIFMPVREK